MNATLGWSWADPIAGLVIAAVAVREGLEAWRGEGCACGPVACLPDTATANGQGDGCGCTDDPTGCTDGCCTTSATSASPETFTIGRRDGGES